MSQTSRTEKAGAKKIVALLKKHYPDARCTLDFKTTHQLLVATILSAQCTDERVNIVTKKLFKKYKNIKDFAAADIDELENDVRSTGFFRNKAKAIRHSARMLIDNYDGRIPDRLDEIVSLPGVGRKTGSVILGVAFDKAEGIVVDTHVMRLSNRLGLTDGKEPLKIEKDLMKLIPKNEWIVYSHMLIDHGRAVCTARRPDCRGCFLKKLCPTSKKYL
jgi:endonuclease-3